MLYVALGIIAAAFIIFSLPFIRLLAKRISLVTRLKRVCKAKGFSLVGVKPLWFLSTNSSKNCDFYIVKEYEILCVKLFGLRRRDSTLVFTHNNRFFLRKYVKGLPPGIVYSSPIETRIKALPEYNFRYKYKLDWELKKPKSVLLINPVSAEIKYAPKTGGERTIGSNEQINNYEIASLSRFISFYVEDIVIL